MSATWLDCPGFDFKRYSELLADVDLSNVTYGYGETDEYVGRLTENEIAFLEAAGAEVVSDPGGHVDAIFALTGPRSPPRCRSTSRDANRRRPRRHPA